MNSFDAIQKNGIFITGSEKKNTFFQPKMAGTDGNTKINPANDNYEKEADTMADKVMRMQQPFVQLNPLPVTAIQRKCAACHEDEKLQRKEIHGAGAAAEKNVGNYISSLPGSGQALSNEARAFYEPRFSYDFSNVRIHNDNAAATSAAAINALAFTSGNHIVFNKGQYDFDSDNGKRLLGHELTHVIQQGNAIQRKNSIQRKQPAETDPLHDPLLDEFSNDTGTEREKASPHSPEYKKWLLGTAADEKVQNYQVKADDLNNPVVQAAFKRMGLQQLLDYRNEYIITGANETVVIKYITDLMLAMPVQPCTKAEVLQTDKLANAAMAKVSGMVNNADRALTVLLSEWVNNKAYLLSKRFSFAGEVSCAFKSNFNIDERNPDFGVMAIRVSSRISQLKKRLVNPVSFSCEAINNPVCLAGTGLDAEAYVVNHQGPVHLCVGFRDSGNSIHQQAIIVHELLHFLPGLKDAGGYSVLGAEMTTCGQNFKFSATTNLLVNSADPITGFIMHIDQHSPTDLKII